MSEVLRELASTPSALGKLNGHIGLTGIGHSLSAFLSSANGDVSINMAGGRLDSLLMELVGLDLGEAIVAALVDRKASVRIHCLVTDFIVSTGRMQTQALIFDTSDTKIEGERIYRFGGGSSRSQARATRQRFQSVCGGSAAVYQRYLTWLQHATWDPPLPAIQDALRQG